MGQPRTKWYFFYPIAEIFAYVTPDQLWYARLMTGLMFICMGVAVASLAGTCVLGEECVSTQHAQREFYLVSFVFGIYKSWVGLSILELLPSVPQKVQINVPYVAGVNTNSVIVGLVATVLAADAVDHKVVDSDYEGHVTALIGLVIASFVLQIFFSTMTKSHWNWMENSGRRFPKNPGDVEK